MKVNALHPLRPRKQLFLRVLVVLAVEMEFPNPDQKGIITAKLPLHLDAYLWGDIWNGFLIIITFVIDEIAQFDSPQAQCTGERWEENERPMLRLSEYNIQPYVVVFVS